MAPPRTPSDVIERVRAVVDYQFPPHHDFDLLPVIAVSPWKAPEYRRFNIQTRIIQTRLRQLLEGIDPVDRYRKVNLPWKEKLSLCNRIWGECRNYRKMMFDLAKFLREDREAIPGIERKEVYVKRYDVVSKTLAKVEIVLEDFGEDDMMDENFDPTGD